MHSDATRLKRDDILVRLGLVVRALQAERVPDALRGYIPLAEFWGLPEDGAISELVEYAQPAELTELVQTVRCMTEELDGWLADNESHAGTPSEEYVRFSCLVIAYELARLRHRDANNA
jgi:hypothetical protein